MTYRRLNYPEGDDWRDHAMPCPNCQEPVLSENAHLHPATMTDPAEYSCDRVFKCEVCDGTGEVDAPFSGSDPSCEECGGKGYT